MDVDRHPTTGAGTGLHQANAIGDLLDAARRGCPTSLGQLFELLRAHLLSIADQELPPTLRAKIGPSDLVQETAMDMQLGFAQFRGSTPEDCFAWLRAMLRNNVIDAVRHFESTQKRSIAREVIGGLPPATNDVRMPLDMRLPDGSAIRREDEAAVRRALASLQPDLRRVIESRYWLGRTFAEIAADLGCTPQAARKSWYRALADFQAAFAADRTALADPVPPTAVNRP